MSTRSRGLLVAALVVVGAGLSTGPLAGQASAHALLNSSTPAAGANVATAPSAVTMTFTEAPDPSLSIVTVTDSTGRTVSSGKAQAVPGQPSELRVPLASIGDGVYTVSWRTVSQVDGHVAANHFAFGVGKAPPASAGGNATAYSDAAVSWPKASAVTAGWLLFTGLALMLSGAVVVPFVFKRKGGTVRGAGSLLVAAAIVAIVGAVSALVVEKSTIGVSLSTLMKSTTGKWLVLELAMAVGAAAAALVVAKWPGRAAWMTLLVISAVALLVHALSGHAAAASSIRVLNLTAEWVHLGAAAIWIGGLAWLLVGIADPSTAERGSVVLRFSKVATCALVIVIGSGVLRAWQELGSFGNLFGTRFGATLLVKIALVAVLVAFGAWNHFRNVPRGDDGVPDVEKTVRRELVLGALIIAVAVVLSQLSPPSYAHSHSAEGHGSNRGATAVTGHDFATSVRVRLSIAPGGVGSNAYTADVTDYDTGKPVPAQTVQLRFSYPAKPEAGTATADLQRRAPGSAEWHGSGTELSLDGLWDIDVVVQEAATSVTVPLQFRTVLPPEQVSMSVAVGQPTLSTVTLAGGDTMQAYVDPGTAGPNAVHFTFFQQSGDEQPVKSAAASSISPAGASQPIKLIRFDPGHFVSNQTLTPGKWTFRINATLADGTVLSAYFSSTVGPSASAAQTSGSPSPAPSLISKESP